MNGKQVWLITGAGRGLGVDIARAALAAGHAVVATGRNPQRVASVLGSHDDLLVAALDVTDPAAAEAAVQAAVDRFGRLDVLVNNAGNFNAGFFEELTPEEFRAQIETTLFGPVNVTRAALPVMRAQRSGLVVTISSTAGIVGGEFLTAYAASKFAVEGWQESLAAEVAPFGIRTMLVEPGFFRTELLTPQSTQFAESTHRRLRRADRPDRRQLEEHERPTGRRPRQARRRPRSDSPPWTNRRCGSPPAPTPSPPSRTEPSCCSSTPTRTAGCPANSATTTRDQRARAEATSRGHMEYAHLGWPALTANPPAGRQQHHHDARLGH